MFPPANGGPRYYFPPQGIPHMQQQSLHPTGFSFPHQQPPQHFQSTPQHFMPQQTRQIFLPHRTLPQVSIASHDRMPQFYPPQQHFPQQFPQQYCFSGPYQQMMMHQPFTFTMAGAPAKPQERDEKRPQHRTSSKFRGVYWNKNCRAWRARIWVDGRSEHLGNFDDEEEAARAFDRRALELKRFRALNFPGKLSLKKKRKAQEMEEQGVSRLKTLDEDSRKTARKSNSGLLEKEFVPTASKEKSKALDSKQEEDQCTVPSISSGNIEYFETGRTISNSQSGQSCRSSSTASNSDRAFEQTIGLERSDVRSPK